jgi:hypothetical protein
MLFGHHNNDANKPAPEPATVDQPVAQVSPTLNPLALDPTTGVSLPVVEDGVATDTVTPVATAPADQADASALQPLSLPSLSTPPTAGNDGGMAPPPLPPQQDTTTVEPSAPPVATEAPAEAAAPEAPIEVQPELPVEAPQEPAEPVAPPPLPELPPEPPVMVLDETPPAEAQPTQDLAPVAPEEPVMPLDQSENAASAPVGDLTNDLLAMKHQALEQLTPLVDQLDQSPEEKFRTKMMMIQSTDDQTLIRDAYEAAQQITDEKARAQALLDIVNEINYFTSGQPNTPQA